MHPLPVRPLGSQTSVLPRTGMNCSFSSFVCMKFPPRLLNKWMGTFLEFLKSEDLKGYFARVEIHCSTTCGNSWWVAGEGGWVDFLSNNVRWINLILWLDNSSISSWISSWSVLQGVVRFSRQVPVAIDFFRASCSVMLFSDTIPISVGSSFSMRSLALFRVFVKWAR